MSLGSSDDDIPGLESVSGSEYLEDSEEESEEDILGVEEEEEEEPNTPQVYSANSWLMFDVTILAQQVEVVRIYVLSPFLYGHAHQSDRWLKWCHEVGLLQSDIEFNLDALADRELVAVDVLLGAIKYVGKSMTTIATKEMPKLLQMMDKVEMQETAIMAARTARRWKWFTALIEEMRKSEDIVGGISKDIFQSKNYFVEMGYLFVINQAIDHFKKIAKGPDANSVSDYQKQLQSHEESGKIMKEEGEEYEKKGDYKEAIETYSTAIICCPYYHLLYINRAHAYMEVKNYRAAMSDGLRAVNLKPDDPSTHICYVMALHASKDAKRTANATTEFNERFPEEREELRRSLDKYRHKNMKKQGPTEKEKVMNDKLLRTCKQASEAYLVSNLDEAVFYYQEALATSTQSEAWKICWVFSECERFLISLHFAFGMALVKKGSSNDAEKALTQFNIIISDYQFLPFPPAHYGTAKALTLLHNHSDARTQVEKGLELLSSYRLMPLTWPGTPIHITECMPHDIEIKLLQLLEQCKPKQVIDAVCRYPNCLQHHTSSDIIVGGMDYKGHVQMQCSEGCCISYHHACWRKFKSNSVVGADRDFLTTICPTPDCGGQIKTVSVYDNGKLKIKFEAEIAPKKATPAAPPTSLNLATSKESKRSSLAKQVKKKSTPGTRVEEPATQVAESLKITEDLRRVEDSLEVINRQAKVEEDEKDVNGSSKSKVKKKTQREKSKTSSEQWSDLGFRFPDREGLMKDDADEDNSSKWERDPAAPFLPPKHLREMIDDFEINEAPSIGLPSRPLGGANVTTPPAAEETPKLPTFDEDIKFFMSYFGEIVKTHGPLDPADPKLLESLSFFTEERKQKIEKAGGIAKLLVDSGHFAIQGDLICHIEEVEIVAASMSKPTDHSGNRDRKESKREEQNNDGKDGVTPSPHAKRSSLSGLLSVNRSSIDDRSGTRQESKGQSRNNTLRAIKVKQQSEEGSQKWDTSALAPKMGNPGSLMELAAKEKRMPVIQKSGAHEDLRKSHSRKDKDSSSSAGSDLRRKELKVKVEGANAVRLTVKSSELSRASSKESSFLTSSSKDSSVTTSGNEGSVSGGVESSSADLGKRTLFSPTNSTSSMSSESSSSGNVACVISSPPPPPQAKKSKNKKAKNKSSAQTKVEHSVETKPALKVSRISVMMQTETPLLTDKWVMTDPLPPVESFKERYENAVKEKKDLHEKLERSEDQKFKLQKTHKREVDQLVQKTKQEAREEMQGRVNVLTENLKSESARVEHVRKENSEQLRSTKAEVKSLTDKIERMKKDLTRKEGQNDSKTRQLQGEIEHLQSERRHYDDRLKVHKETETKAIIRATNAEVEVLNMRSDFVVKPWEQKMREIDAVCMTIPQGSDMHRECMGYREKMKTALDTYQSAIDNQMRLVKSGCDLSSLERVPAPVVPIPPHLGMMMMRTGFFPMMSVPRAPFGVGGMGPMPGMGPMLGPGPGGMVDPSSMMMNKPPRAPGMMGGIPVSMASFQSQPDFEHPMSNPPNPEPESSSQAAASPSELDINGGTSTKKSSFDRIVEKLGPLYPQYNRDDFKLFLREVRRNNKNTLSGLSLDSIAQQVKGIIDQQERKSGGTRGGGGAPIAKGVAKGSSKIRQIEKKGKKPRLPMVAVAPPPVSSSVTYDENACIICYEEMGDIDSSRLNCGHSFHSECIRSWFKEQSTCPTCRNHSLLVDEYPTLK